MPTLFTHSAVGYLSGLTFMPKKQPVKFWFFALLCAILPDGDVLGFTIGVPYSHFFGHRGFFHSIFFAVLFSLCITLLFFRDRGQMFTRKTLYYFVFFFLVGASHGLLDAFTNGGLGIALLSPFSNERIFFWETPIKVSPIGVKSFFQMRSLHILKNEFLWVWLPMLSITTILKLALFLREKLLYAAGSGRND